MSRQDLTRWNRAALSHFRYVDGNASVWLQNLQLAMVVRFMHSADPRFTDTKFLNDVLTGKSNLDEFETLELLLSDQKWSDLWNRLGKPVEGENSIARNRRLLANYNAKSDDYSHEIMRAFARASHIMLEYTNAYANEGYIRTATQWDNVSKLARSVGYQPSPPASATTHVALIVVNDQNRQTITRGMGMRYTPTDGGPPLVFETLSDVDVHSELNGARHRKHDVDPTEIDFSVSLDWKAETKNLELASGELAVLAPHKSSAPNEKAVLLSTVIQQSENCYSIAFTGSEDGELIDNVVVGRWRRGYARLLVAPKGVLTGLPRQTDDAFWALLDETAGIVVGDVVELRSLHDWAVVAEIDGRFVRLNSSKRPTQPFSVRPMAKVSADADKVVHFATSIQKVYFNNDGRAVPKNTVAATTTGNVIFERRATVPVGSDGTAFIVDEDAADIAAEPAISPISPARGSFNLAFDVTFEGKPDKAIKRDSWFVARHGQSLKALRVLGIAEGDGFYVLNFNANSPGLPKDTEYHGPLSQELRPVDWNRNPARAIGEDNTVELRDLQPDAEELIKPGGVVIIEDERWQMDGLGVPPVLATVIAVAKNELGDETVNLRDQGNHTTVSLGEILSAKGENLLAGFQAGWTKFRFNNALVGHGESKGSMVLGSGNGERNRQAFTVAKPNISFVPNPAALSGVEPAIDVVIDDTIWPYRDLLDFSAEGTQSYSISLKENDQLEIVFRRRLTTGLDNIKLNQHRLGTGPRGNLVPAFALSKPAKRHRSVLEIVQPFATAGGAEREATEEMRTNAPSSLKANGRAVSLADYGRIAARHAAVGSATALATSRTGRFQRIEVVVVPASGNTLPPSLLESIEAHILTKAPPGVQVTVAAFDPVLVQFSASIWPEEGSADPVAVVKAARMFLLTKFAIAQRSLGQRLYVAEVLAALEDVEGVRAATATMSLPQGSNPKQLVPATGATALRTIVPYENQVVYVASNTAISLEIAS